MPPQLVHLFVELQDNGEVQFVPAGVTAPEQHICPFAPQAVQVLALQ
ncbi:MAG: hypothetical protein WC759_05015 [Candidatus Micrarchaeia archaeon]|jgi:hypothetical protein